VTSIMPPALTAALIRWREWRITRLRQAARRAGEDSQSMRAELDRSGSRSLLDVSGYRRARDGQMNADRWAERAGRLERANEKARARLDRRAGGAGQDTGQFRDTENAEEPDES
jgi:hypothetical protein